MMRLVRILKRLLFFDVEVGLYGNGLLIKKSHNYRSETVEDINNIRLVEEVLQVTASEIFVSNELDLIKALHIKYGGDILCKSVFNLHEKDPDSCAIETFTFKQVVALGLQF